MRHTAPFLNRGCSPDGAASAAGSNAASSLGPARSSASQGPRKLSPTSSPSHGSHQELNRSPGAPPPGASPKLLSGGRSPGQPLNPATKPLSLNSSRVASASASGVNPARPMTLG